MLSYTVIINHCRKPVEHFLKTVEEVSLKDITTIAQKIISSPLTMASFGNGKFPMLYTDLILRYYYHLIKGWEN